MRWERTIGGIAAWAVVFGVGCSRSDRPLAELGASRWALAGNDTVVLGDLLGRQATVFITLDPECPFSQAYTTVLDSLYRAFAPAGVAFAGVYPGAFFQAADVSVFAQRSGLAFPQVMDHDCVLARALEARVTPEAFVIASDGRSIYKGAIDDSAVRAGRKKPEATKHYLRDVLQGVLAVTTSDAQEVTAVGCIVECR